MNDVFNSFVDKIATNIIDPAMVLLGLVAFGLFAFGVVEMIWYGGDQEKRTTGRRHMIWGLIGLAIMFGAKAIVDIMIKTIGSTTP
jgi:hypothetical protein